MSAQTPAFELKIEELTAGEKHHFFGDIGRCQTIQWNASRWYILGLEIDRIDPAPRWNRTNDAILVPGIADNGTRQMFIIPVIPTGGN